MCVIDNNWLVVESPFINPDCLLVMNLFDVKYEYSDVKINLSKTFPKKGKSDIGR